MTILITLVFIICIIKTLLILYKKDDNHHLKLKDEKIFRPMYLPKNKNK